ncbi:glycosyltransferase family 2 protein [Kocuria flava]|uniref:glycosyltransferase family 2 protein n=1 Tax=Kocuria flava TaxID=446860 RepID=UPI001FF4F06F|nr:glycosyltransferase family 2 protein [Kocuria flava]MCJ8506127.1 glycosyltransferase family 2 protein [Kocuria flava]
MSADLIAPSSAPTTAPRTAAGFASDQPSVSVLIATAGRPKMLREAVRAIVEQDYAGPLQVVVVFDRIDVDALADVAVPAGVELLTVPNTRTPGLAGARNTGIAAATGEIIAFCDDDDVWAPRKLTRQVAHWILHPEASAIAGTIRIVSHDREISRTPQPVATFPELLADRMMEIHPSALICRRADLLGPVGTVDEALPASYGEDYDLLLRLARHAPVHSVPETVLTVRWDRPSFFREKWADIAAALEYMLRKFPEFGTSDRGTALLAGQVAFAHAASGQRRQAVRWARAALQHDAAQLRAWGALVVATGLIGAERLQNAVSFFGRGL